MERGVEYDRLKVLLFATVGVAAALGAVRYFLPDRGRVSFDPPPTLDMIGSYPPPPPRSYRPPIAPKSSFTPDLKRSTMSQYTIADMNDRGDFLFFSSTEHSKIRQYFHMYKGKQEDLGVFPSDYRLFLSTDGEVIKRRIPSQAGPTSQSRFISGPMISGYNEIRFFRRVNDDGSILNVHYEPKKRVPNFVLKLDRLKGDGETYFSSHNSLVILDRPNDNLVWIKEAIGDKEELRDNLFRLEHKKLVPVQMPPKYQIVERVASNDKIVTATFRDHANIEPIRSFIQTTDRGWKELPMPSEYVFSFVQKVLDNGMILGIITDSNRMHAKQVIWKDDSVAVLNDLKAWPKNGQVAYVVQATRRGDLYVRNITDTASGTGDNYLLKIQP